MMLAERRANDLDTWLTQAERSGLPEFKKLVKGIRQDCAAVRAAFSSQWSNGQVEAQVNWRTASKTLGVRESELRLTAASCSVACVAVSHDPALNPSMTSHHASRTSKQAGTH